MTDIFFRWDANWIQKKQWAALPQASKSIFPVIAASCNQNGDCFLSEKYIGERAGVNEKTARTGIRGLEKNQLIFCGRQITKRGNWVRTFHINFPKRKDRVIYANDNSFYFFFYKKIIDTNTWCNLKPTAQALYPVMRHFGFLDEETIKLTKDFDLVALYSGTSQIGLRQKMVEIWRERRFEYCLADLSALSKLSGISYRSVKSAMNSLVENRLIDLLEEIKLWRVYLRPNIEHLKTENSEGIMLKDLV